MFCESIHEECVYVFIAAYLNISRGNAYTLLHREDFPALRIGKRMIAPRDKFIAWLDQQMSA
ncbi:MAG: helix-turn-helix domain-containing protein [Oscillospiraceae bacterium]|nr:helix-turn-helix domain-containing protein [Oscillospiraceae bacterium]